MTSNDDFDINFDTLPDPISAESLIHGWEWEQPCVAAEMTEVAQFLRDHCLHPLRHQIEQSLGFDSLVSIDWGDQTRPIQIRWDTQIVPTTSWSNKWGVVCQGMQVLELTEGRQRPIGMVQLGGTWVDAEQFQHLPNGSFIREWFRKKTGRYYLLLLESYFLTRWSIEHYNPTLTSVMKEPEALWHQVHTQQHWLDAICVLGAFQLQKKTST